MRRVGLLALVGITLVGIAVLTTPAATQTSGSGSWTSMGSLPVFPTSMQLAPTGKVLFFAGDVQGTPPGTAATTLMAWDPATGQSSTLVASGYDLFCVGHAYFPDGRMLYTGGHISNFVGLPNASAYDPFANTWTPLPGMNAGRWYPTNTTLPNGDILVLSGQIDTTVGVNPLPQVYSASTGSPRDLTNAQLTLDLYPRMHVAPNGLVFNSGPSPTTRYLDTSGTGNWTVVGDRAAGYRDYGSAVMYDTGKILFVGGGDPPTGAAEVIDLNAASPSWRTVGSLATPRRHLNATLLPDGKVLVTGGTFGPGFNDTSSPAFAAEMWDPATEQWTTMASQTVGRFYHSVALLLPDGRVMSAGGNGHPEIELFSPPYLSNGTRPQITGAPTSVGYGQSFSVQTPNAASIRQVTLIKLPAVTHAFDQNQRFMRLGFTAGSGNLTVTAPPSGNVAPPGHYMLFILNGQGVPSVAQVIQVGAAGASPPPPPPPSGGGTLSVFITQPTAGSTLSGFAWVTVWLEGSTGTNNTVAATLDGHAAGNTTSSTAGPISFPIDTTVVADGSHSLVVSATDASGNTGSGSLSVVTRNGITTPPGGGGTPLSAAITSPASGSTVNGTINVTMSATGGTAPYQYTLTVDSTTLASNATSNTVSWNTANTANGGHTLTATITDAANARATATASVTVSNTTAPPPPPPPATGTLGVFITQPSNGATVTGTSWVTLWLEGSSGTSNTYTLTVAGRSVATTTTSSKGPVSMPWDSTTVPSGPQTLTATARDATGNTGSGSISINVSNANSPPPNTTPLGASVSAPSSGSTVSGTVNVTIAASGGTPPYTYTITAGGTTLASGSTSNTVAWDTTRVADGSQTVSGTVRDSTGTTATASATVNVSNTTAPPPSGGGTLQVFITQPSSGATVQGTVWFVVWLGGASSGSSTYTLSVGGRTVWGPTSSSQPASLPWVTSTADNGARTVTVTVQDSSGNSGSGSINVNVAN
jgi:Domain of unknown function (DUF1929)/Bacterial Ig domain